MTTIEQGGAKATFEDVEDILLSATYHRYNVQAFDGLLPSDVKVRWAEVIGSDGFLKNGWLCNDNPSVTTHIFIDDRLRALPPRLPYLVNIVLLHEMCHFRIPNHDDAFVRELLLALERVSWEPLVTKCVPFSLKSFSG